MLQSVLVAMLFFGWSAGMVRGQDLEVCRLLRQQRDALISQAMDKELELVRSIRKPLCPKLSLQAEGANARDQNYGPIDYAAWSRCRLQAERQLESTHPIRYRNGQGFTFYTAIGASLAREADQRSAALIANECSQLVGP